MVFLSLAEILEEIAEFVNECLGPLGQDGLSGDKMVGYARDIIVQLIATLIIFLLVRFKFWKPITNILEKRRQSIDDEIAKAEESSLKAQAYELELREKLDKASNDIKIMLDNAEAQAYQRREEIIQAAKDEAQSRLDRVSFEIEQEIKNKNTEIKELIVDVAFLAASKIVEQDVDKEKYLALVNEIIEGAMN